MYSIIEVPFHLGLEEVAVGKGPAELLRAGIDAILSHRGMPAAVNHVRPRDLRSKGNEAIMDINRMLRYAVKDAIEQETTPVVLAGNCNSCIGTIAGMDAERPGIVWLDRHPDYNTPETTITGNIEGMALAIATGHCHQQMAEFIGLNTPVEDQNVVLAGFWDVDPGEKVRLEESWISAHPVDSLGLLPVALHQLAERVDGVYFHIDTDFLEGSEKPEDLIRLVCESVPVKAVGVTNYNPVLDSTGVWRKAILSAVGALQSKPN